MDSGGEKPQDTKPLQPTKVTTYGVTSLSNKIWCLTVRMWWLLILALQSLLFILSIGCLGSTQWLEQNGLDIQGSLMRCTDCPSRWQDASYDEIADLICEDDNLLHSLCDMMKDMRDAGAVYVFFELVAIVCLFFWMFKIMLLLLERQCFPKLRWLPYTFPVLTICAHLIALAAWFGITDASFSDSCDNVTDSVPPICATAAPALSVCLMLLYFLITVLFIISFCKFRSLCTSLEQKEDKDPVPPPLQAPGPPSRR